MTASRDLDGELEPPMPEALGWVVRLTSGDATQEDARAFERWRADSPAHETAFREAAAFRRSVRAMDLPPPQTATILPFRTGRAVTTRRAVLSGGIAASFAAWMAIEPPLGLWPSFAELTAGHRTGTGQRVRLTPMAGVAVEMNARSALSMADAGQGMSLIEGEAFVSANGVRPFTIAAGGERISVATGSLNIRTSERETCVTCIAGTVERRRGDERTVLRSGQQLVSTSTGSQVAAVDPHIPAAWRQGLLVFRDTPLADAVEAVNRYRSGKIILTSEALGNRPVNGLFHTDQIENAVDQFQQLLHVGITHLPGGVVLLG